MISNIYAANKVIIAIFPQNKPTASDGASNKIH